MTIDAMMREKKVVKDSIYTAYNVASYTLCCKKLIRIKFADVGDFLKGKLPIC
jgi:hypothetical protein